LPCCLWLFSFNLIIERHGSLLIGWISPYRVWLISSYHFSDFIQQVNTDTVHIVYSSGYNSDWGFKATAKGRKFCTDCC